jgi:hypothetical protein
VRQLTIETAIPFLIWAVNANRWRFLLRMPAYVGLSGSFLIGEMHCLELVTRDARVARNAEK